MKNLLPIIVCFFLICIGTTSLWAQNGVIATGGNATGSNGSASFSVGQIDYTASINSAGSFNSGIQQPFEIFVTTGINETRINLVPFSVFVYPNPINEFMNLQIEDIDLAGLSFQLYDLQGKIILDKKVDGKLTTISISELANATYFIKVLNNNEELKRFKIIKN
jgi:hypothetical protein